MTAPGDPRGRHAHATVLGDLRESLCRPSSMGLDQETRAAYVEALRQAEAALQADRGPTGGASMLGTLVGLCLVLGMLTTLVLALAASSIWLARALAEMTR